MIGTALPWQRAPRRRPTSEEKKRKLVEAAGTKRPRPDARNLLRDENFPRIRLQRQRKFGPAVSAVVPSCAAPVHCFMATARQQNRASAFVRAREARRLIRYYHGPKPLNRMTGA